MDIYKKDPGDIPDQTRPITLVTPLIMFSTWEHTVFVAASSLCLPNHLSTFKVFLPTICMLTGRCRKLRTRVPREPVTVTLRDFTFTITENDKTTSKTTTNPMLITLQFTCANIYSCCVK